jgi:hypothetical protein
MAFFDYDIYGSVPVVKKFQFGVTLTTVGIPFTVPASNTAGVVIGTTTTATDLVGMSIDKGTVLHDRQAPNPPSRPRKAPEPRAPSGSFP